MSGNSYSYDHNPHGRSKEKKEKKLLGSAHVLTPPPVDPFFPEQHKQKPGTRDILISDHGHEAAGM